MTERERRAAPFGQGRRLYELRRHRGMSQGMLAHLLDVSVGTIQNYEHDRATMTLRRVEEIASALKVQPADLFAPPGSALPKYSEPRLIQHERTSLWPMAMGFYGRSALITSIDDLRWEADRLALQAIGLAPNAPHQQVWLEWLRRIHPDDRPQVERELDLLKMTGVFGMQYRIVGWDGVERTIVDGGRTTYDTTGRPGRLQGTMIDVTRLRRTKVLEFNIALFLKMMRQT